MDKLSTNELSIAVYAKIDLIAFCSFCERPVSSSRFGFTFSLLSYLPFYGRRECVKLCCELLEPEATPKTLKVRLHVGR